MTMKGVFFCLTIGLVLAGRGADAKFVSTNPCIALQNGYKLPNSEDCSTYFVCEFNQMTKTKCDEGTLFDPKLLVCNWAELVDCSESSIVQPSETVVTTRRPVRFPVRISTTTVQTTTITQQKVKTVPNRNQEVMNGEVWQNGWPQNNNYWYPEMQAPYYPNFPMYPPQYPQFGGGYNMQGVNHQPVTDITTTSTTTRTTTTTTPRTTAVRTTRIPPTRASFLPPKSTSGLVIPLDEDLHLKCNNQEGLSFMPHPKNCENYYICTNGIMVLHQCASGIHWNEKDSQCDFPHRANCFANQRPASAPHIEQPVVLPKPLVCDGTERFLAHPDCDKYYICAGSTPTLMSCPDNFLWNASASKCDHSNLVTCPSN